MKLHHVFKDFTEETPMKYLSRQELKTVPDMQMANYHRTPHPDDHFIMGRVSIDNSACNGCELCVDACPANALKMAGKNIVEMVGDSAGCVGCGACVAICLPDIIRITQFQQYEGLYRFIGRSEASHPRRF
jgi:ferredoxin